MSTTPEQAGLDALCAWLTTSLGTDVVVSDCWPESQVLPAKAVSVLLAGPSVPTDIPFTQTAMVATTGNLATYEFQTGYREQPIQIDAWAQSDYARKDLCARLGIALNAGSAPISASSYRDPQGGLMVPLAPPFSGTADVLCETPEYTDNPDSIQRSEYRATYRGQLTVAFTISQVAARFKTAELVKTVT